VDILVILFGAASSPGRACWFGSHGREAQVLEGVLLSSLEAESSRARLLEEGSHGLVLEVSLGGSDPLGLVQGSHLLHHEVDVEFTGQRLLFGGHSELTDGLHLPSVFEGQLVQGAGLRGTRTLGFPVGAGEEHVILNGLFLAVGVSSLEEFLLFSGEGTDRDASFLCLLGRCIVVEVAEEGGLVGGLLGRVVFVV